MKRILLTIGLVTAGLCMAFSVKKEINHSLKQSAAADTTKRKTELYNASDFEDGTTMRARTGAGKNEMVYTFKREGVLYQVFTNRGYATDLYINGKQEPVSANKDKIAQLMDEYQEIAATPLPPVPAVPPIEPLSPPAILASVPPVAPALPIEPVTGLNDVAPVPAIPRIPEIAPLAKIQPVPALPPLPPVPPVAPDSLSIEITNALIKQGAIKNKHDYDVHITNKVLIIDGVKQSDELHRQVIDKMTKKPGDKVNWNFSRHD